MTERPSPLRRWGALRRAGCESGPAPSPADRFGALVESGPAHGPDWVGLGEALGHVVVEDDCQLLGQGVVPAGIFWIVLLSLGEALKVAKGEAHPL